MGNCLTSNKIQAQVYQGEAMEEETAAVEECSKLEGPKVGGDEEKIISKKKKKKKVVRFKLNEESNIGSEGGIRQGQAVRIRLVVTQKELKQILSSRKDDLKHSSSMEQLIRVVKLRGVKVSESDHGNDDDGLHRAWRPALESIPEEH